MINYHGATGVALPSGGVTYTIARGYQQLSQSVSLAPFPNPANGGAFAVNATTTSGMPVSLSVLSGSFTVNGNMITPTAAGPAWVGASAPAGTTTDGFHWHAATPVYRAFTIHPLPITFANMSRTYGDAAFALSSSSTSNSTPFYSILSQTPAGTVSLSGSTVSILGVGSANVRVTYPATSSYMAGSADATLTVGKRSQAISFAAIADRVYGDPPFAAPTTSTSGLPVAVTISGPALMLGGQVSIGGVGPVAITASQPGNEHHLAAPDVTRSFTVTKAGQSVTFGSIANRTFGEPPFVLSATSSVGLPVTLVVAAGPAVVLNKTATVTGVGTVTITASLPGDAYYAAATSITQTFQVSADTTAPGVPTGLAASELTATSVSLTWTAPSDNIGVTGYKVTGFGATPRFVSGTNVKVPLAPQTVYTLWVQATDAAGNWSPAVTASVTSLADTSGSADSDGDTVPNRVEDLLGTDKNSPGTADSTDQTTLRPHKPN